MALEDYKKTAIELRNNDDTKIEAKSTRIHEDWFREIYDKCFVLI